MGYKIPQTNLQNVAPGNVATLKVAVGKGAPTYDQIKLELGGGLTLANIEYVRGKINGRIFYDEAGGAAINDRDEYKGIFTESGVCVLDFTEPKARNGAAEQLVSCLPGHLMQDLSFEIKIAADANANSTLKAYANVRPPTANPWIKKILHTTQTFSAAGTDGAPNIMYLPVGDAGGKVKRFWIHEAAAGNITGVQLRIANNIVYDATRARIENDQKRNGLTPQTGICVLDFVEDGNLAGVLDTSGVPNVELRLTMTAGDTLNLYTELLDPIARL